MEFKLWLESMLPQELQGINSQQEFNDRLKQIGPAGRENVLNWVKEINREGYAKKLGTSNPILLHHGSPNMDLKELKPMPGKRSLGFLGAMYDVENLGVFMTNSKPIANYFGSNRSKYGRDYKVYDAYCKVENPLNVNNIPLTAKKIGLQLVNSYNGTKKTKLAMEDIWWLLDKPQFVDEIKKSGYDAMVFTESRKIRKESGDLGGLTYFIMNPNNILMVAPHNDTIKNLDDLYAMINNF